MRIFVLAGLLASTATSSFAQSPDHRFLVTANAGVQALSNMRTDTVEFELFAETGSFAVTQTIGPQTVFDGSGAIRLASHFAMGVAVSHAHSRTTGDVNALVPHPFFFDFHRAAHTTASDLGRRELGVHIQGQIWIPLRPSILMRVSFGPTVFNASQDVVTSIMTSEVGTPYDEVNIVSHETEGMSVTSVGYHAEVDLAYFLNDWFGIGFTSRYSRATPSIDIDGANQPALRLGGLHLVGGVRLGF